VVSAGSGEDDGALPTRPHRDPSRKNATNRWCLTRRYSPHPFSKLLPFFPMRTGQCQPSSTIAGREVCRAAVAVGLTLAFLSGTARLIDFPVPPAPSSIGDGASSAPLVIFHGQDVVRFPGDDVLRGAALAVQSIRGDDGAGDVHGVEKLCRTVISLVFAPTVICPSTVPVCWHSAASRCVKCPAASRAPRKD